MKSQANTCTRLLLSQFYGIPDPLRGIDINKEVQLIRKKQSKLSANMRASVMLRHSQEMVTANDCQIGKS